MWVHLKMWKLSKAVREFESVTDQPTDRGWYYSILCHVLYVNHFPSHMYYKVWAIKVWDQKTAMFWHFLTVVWRFARPSLDSRTKCYILYFQTYFILVSISYFQNIIFINILYFQTYYIHKRIIFSNILYL